MTFDIRHSFTPSIRVGFPLKMHLSFVSHSELERDVIELQEQARITARANPILLDAVEEKAALLRKAGEGLAELHG